MAIQGSIFLHDHQYVSSFFGSVIYGGRLDCTDTTYLSPIAGYILLDSTRLPGMTFTQGTFLGWGMPPAVVGMPPLGFSAPSIHPDPTSMWSSGADPAPDQVGTVSLVLRDKTYSGGYYHDGTYFDTTLQYRWYDPVWVNYSLWYTQDASHPLLIGYRYREPIEASVGNYYVTMEVPRTTGHYDIRWRYEKDNSSYAHEIIQPFLCRSEGIDADRT